MKKWPLCGSERNWVLEDDVLCLQTGESWIGKAEPFGQDWSEWLPTVLRECLCAIKGCTLTFSLAHHSFAHQFSFAWCDWFCDKVRKFIAFRASEAKHFRCHLQKREDWHERVWLLWRVRFGLVSPLACIIYMRAALASLW